MTRLRRFILLLLIAGSFGVILLSGVADSGQLLYFAFAGLMLYMCVFGHGSHGHGGSHDEHSGHKGSDNEAGV